MPDYSRLCARRAPYLRPNVPRIVASTALFSEKWYATRERAGRFGSQPPELLTGATAAASLGKIEDAFR